MHMGVPNEQGVSTGTPEARRLGRVGADAVMRCSRLSPAHLYNIVEWHAFTYATWHAPHASQGADV